MVSLRECRAMRVLARDGWTGGELRMTMHVSRTETVRNHVLGNCSCEHGVEPLRDWDGKHSPKLRLDGLGPAGQDQPIVADGGMPDGERCEAVSASVDSFLHDAAMSVSLDPHKTEIVKATVEDGELTLTLKGESL